MVRLGLVVAVVALGMGVYTVATGGLGRVATAIGDTVDGVLDRLTATPKPSPTQLVASDSPILEAPDEPYTNRTAVDLVVTVPREIVGDEESVLRLYLALEGLDATQIAELPVGTTPRMVIPDVALTPGRNDFSATLFGVGGESEPSPVVTWILDQTPPKIELTAPTEGATVNRATVEVVGTTQGRSTLVARNDANSASVTGGAASDGSFRLTLPLDAGTNSVVVTATDPAGNVGEVVVTVRRGAGKLVASVTATPVRLRLAQLPTPLRVTVSVTDPDGRALPEATVTFVVTAPGLPPVTFETDTGSDGKATFETTIAAGAVEGSLGVDILVTTTDYGTATARTALTVAP
jgi:hypothetical protein